jgi:GNAT superfamily N-acetyltransferase
MLLGSCSVVSAWQGDRLVGIGRATSDGVFRAVLWDVVVAEEHQGLGLGRRIVQALLASRLKAYILNASGLRQVGGDALKAYFSGVGGNGKAPCYCKQLIQLFYGRLELVHRL